MAGAVFFTTPVFAQVYNSPDARLDRMEREMQTLSRSIFKGDVPPPQYAPENNAQLSSFEVRLGQIEDQLRTMTGLIEENSFKLRQLETKMSQQAVSSAPVQPSPQSPEPESNLSVSNEPYQLGSITNNNISTPAGLYDQAFSYIQAKDYASAQESFDDFLKKYPTHSLSENAKYWLAETYFERGDFKESSRAFALSFKDAPEGQKAPDSLLKLAMSLNKQDMNKEACLTLAELKNRFPNASSFILTQADEASKSYVCE